MDLQARELRKGGIRLKVHDQPFQILAALAQRPGEVVTREELRQRLWPGDTFVDFDHSINTAVNKLRETLGDSAETPRLIETIARRGYRFVAPVETVTVAASMPEAVTPGTTPARPAAIPVSAVRRPWIRWAAAAALAGLIIFATVWWHRENRQPPTHWEIRSFTNYPGAPYDARRAAHDLKKLRGKGLINRMDKSRRYTVPPQALRAIAALVLLREKVIRPILAGIAQPKMGRKPKNWSPIDTHYEVIRQNMFTLFEDLGIAA